MNLVSDILVYMRRIIKSPSDQNIPDALLLDYLNRFYTYDVPARLQLFELKTVFNLVTSPLIDQYNLPYDINGNLQYQGLINPVYCDGVQLSLITNQDTFFKAYPNYQYNEIDAIGDGGASYTYTTTQGPIIRAHIDVLGNNNPGVYITALNVDNVQMVVTDSGNFEPTNNNIGLLGGDGTGSINYETGQITVTFISGVPAQNPIQTKYANFSPGTPRIMMFFNNIITVRPIPNTAYLLQFNAYLTPASFLSTADALQFGYMSEYLARGAARKILSDSADMEQLQFYEPFFKEQEMLVLRRTDRQNSVNRTPTIYSEMTSQSANWYGIGTGGT